MAILDASDIYLHGVWNTSNIFLQLRQVDQKSPLLMSVFTQKKAAVWLQLKVQDVLVTSFLVLTEFLDFYQRNGVQIECMKEDTEKTPTNHPKKSPQKQASPANPK